MLYYAIIYLYTLLYYAILCYVSMLYYAIRYETILFYTIRYDHTRPYYTYYTILYNVLQFSCDRNPKEQGWQLIRPLYVGHMKLFNPEVQHPEKAAKQTSTCNTHAQKKKKKKKQKGSTNPRFRVSGGLRLRASTFGPNPRPQSQKPSKRPKAAATSAMSSGTWTISTSLLLGGDSQSQIGLRPFWFRV